MFTPSHQTIKIASQQVSQLSSDLLREEVKMKPLHSFIFERLYGLFEIADFVDDEKIRDNKQHGHMNRLYE